MKNRLISAFLTTSMLLTMAGCAESNIESSTTSDTSVSTSTQTETEAATTSASSTNFDEPDILAPDSWNPDVVQRQQELDDSYLCGVVLIGYVDGEAGAAECIEILRNSEHAAEFDFIADLPNANCINAGNGNELYLIIPQDPYASVAVNEWLLTEENGYMGETGEVYYRSEVGAPILLKCNFSDIMPSSVINIVDSDGDSLQWCPSISLKDGSVNRYRVEDLVLDMTHYLYNETYEAYQIEQ